MKLWAMLCGATQDERVMVESSDKMWSTGEGNSKSLHYLCLENPMNSSVPFCHSIVSDSLRPFELQHARPPCLSPTAGVYPKPCPLSRWCHPTISSSVVSFSSCPQCFPASGSFQMSQLFTSDGQSIGVSASTSVLLMSTQDWSPLGWTGWTSCSPRDSQEPSLTPQFKSINPSAFSFLYSATITSLHDYWKSHSLE